MPFKYEAIKRRNREVRAVMNRVQELRCGRTRCYLIGGMVLLDTGWAGTLPLLLKSLREAGAAPGDVKYLLITHFHPDHMGLAQELVDLGMQLVVFDVQKDYLHFSDKILGQDKRTGFTRIDDSRALFVPCSESRELLQSAGVCAEVIATPGHSEDSVSLLLDGGVALVGDLPPLSLMRAYQDPKIEQSWRDVLSRGICTLYYAHADAEHTAGVFSMGGLA